MINRFEKYQDAKQEARTALIVDYLKSLSRSLKIRNVTHLADLVADYLAEKQGKPCTRSTLLRNDKYKKLLLNHMVTGKAGQGSVNIKESEIRDPKAKTLIRTLQLENTSLRREAVRLKAYIESIEKAGSPGQRQLGSIPSTQSSVSDDNRDIEFAFVCKALLKVIHHFGTILSIKYDERRLIDLSVVRNGTIVEGDEFTPFLLWLQRHPETSAAFGL